MSDISQEPDLGYIFYPYDAFEHPGHPRLDVTIQEKPTYRHFDPVEASFLVVSRMVASFGGAAGLCRVCRGGELGKDLDPHLISRLGTGYD